MPVIKPISEQARALAAIQQSIARGYDDLTNARIRPWKQAKIEADRMRASSQTLPHVTIP